MTISIANSPISTYIEIIKNNKIKEIRAKGKHIQKAISLVEMMGIEKKIEIIGDDEIVIFIK